MARAQRSTTSVVYQIKVTLKGSRPPIWRRIQVTSDTTLVKLHRILQRVMGWEGSHLYQFVIGGTPYGEPSSSTSMISGIAGTTSCLWKKGCHSKRENAIRSASRANGPVLPRIAGAFGATPVFWKRSAIQSTPSTRRCWNGSGARLTQKPLIWTR